MSTPGIHSTVPVIATDDIEKSIAYFVDVLCFSFDFKYGEPCVYAGVKAGNAEIYFTHDVALAKSIKENDLHPEIFIWIENAETLFMNHVLNNAEIVEPMFDRAWGARQYVVKEINGYYLKFSQPLH